MLFSECGASGECKTPVIASLASHCAIHLAQTIGCLTSVEAAGLVKIDEVKFNSLVQTGTILVCLLAEEPSYSLFVILLLSQGSSLYPPDSLREIASKYRLKKHPTVEQPDSELLSVTNGSSLVRIKQEILDQSNLSSEDLRVSEPLDNMEAIEVGFYCLKSAGLWTRGFILV